MYLASEAVRFVLKDKENELSKEEAAKLNAYKRSLDHATRFIPLWVKVAVAIALGLGTMIGWKRIVVTVGREDRQIAPDLRAGRSRGDRRRGHHRCSRRTWPAGVDHARALIRRCGNDGGEQVRPAVGDRAQPTDGLGADSSDGRHAVGHALLRTCPGVLRRLTSRHGRDEGWRRRRLKAMRLRHSPGLREPRLPRTGEQLSGRKEWIDLGIGHNPVGADAAHKMMRVQLTGMVEPSGGHELGQGPDGLAVEVRDPL